MFRIIYGGSAYSFAHDPDFSLVGYKEKQWQEVINEYYNKYKGLANWHKYLIQTAIATGELVMPTGRAFTYKAILDYRGNYKWPETTIKNYPVQGSGADVMSIIRIDFGRRFRREKIKGLLISTVHDSIVVDVEDSEVDKVIQMFYDVYEDMPKNFKKIFNVEYNLPLYSEISIGPNFNDLIEV